MARPNRQKERRAELVAAAREAIIQRGVIGLRLKDVAERVGMTASSVFYYYPAIGDLLRDVLRDAVERFCIDRAAAVVHIADPALRLAAMIRTGLPAGPDDALCRLLYELGSVARRDAVQAARYIALYERQVGIYVAILEAGAAQGQFKLNESALAIARNFVTLEDGYGLHVTMAVPTFTPQAAEALIRSYASIATGCNITEIDLDSEAGNITR
ncbi:TetR/AcrR family transcriptional regulator [Dongia sp.]|uniref:TetR/AcrR family transcriptional regulator n=1 Tax=Dongia sp. TaxID=1977262 RepID=UPI00375161A4